MIEDRDFKQWQEQWRSGAEPHPDLKKKIRRQNRRKFAGVAAIILCALSAALAAHRFHSAALAGLACGVAFAGLVMGPYSWWAQRGAWRPAAETTLAYTELSYRRAAAKARTLRFSFRFLAVTFLLYAALLAWRWKHLDLKGPLVGAAMAIELVWLKGRERRKRREAEDTERLLTDMKDFRDMRD